MIFNWDDEKNLLLRASRGVSFEQIVAAIEDGGVVDVLRHPNQEKYRNQKIYLVELRDYIYAVPFLKDPENEEIILKTIYPSRKYTKLYLKKDEGHE